ncbi:MAG: B12-binding domain-containing radical SAM protein [Candidatus Riflebacteria bacterium]|nr:B12-binding domain-containing radical SAM protein [Candidatus Riflebacteria bacterium]
MDLNTDILFAATPLAWGQEFRADIKPPLNLIYLASYLASKGFKTVVHDVISSRYSFEKTLELIRNHKPIFLGIPFYQATLNTATALCKAVKQILPETIILAGGAIASTSPESLLEYPEIDICVIGEGELTVEDLLNTWHKTGSDFFETVPGLMLKKHGSKITTPSRRHIENLDLLPFLDFKLIDIDWYFNYQSSVNMSQWLFLTTSRGCTAKCTYCATPVIWPGSMRRQSVKRLSEEILHQRKFFPEASFGFMDDSFFSDKNWLSEFFHAAKALKLRYCCIGRADHLTNGDVKCLAETGCIYVGLGIETGNQLRQKKLRKHLNLDKVRSAVTMLAAEKIFCKCFFMLGFPDEAPQEMLETINFAVELKKLGMDECNFFPVSVYPGTELAVNFSNNTNSSAIYRSSIDENHYAAEKINETTAEARLLRYANIPVGNVNKYFTTARILEIVKLAYKKVEIAEIVTLSELKQV